MRKIIYNWEKVRYIWNRNYQIYVQRQESLQMKRQEILRSLMLQKGMCIADIVRITQIPYSTVKAILENGVERSSYSYICAICHALGITTDELEQIAAQEVSPQDVQILMSDISELSDAERKQLKHYIHYLYFLRDEKTDGTK